MFSRSEIVFRKLLSVRHALHSFAVDKAIRNGDLHRDARRWDEAAAAYHKALSLRPALAGIWVQYGHALKEAGELTGCADAYREAMKQGLDSPDIYLQMGHVLKLQGHRAKAAASYGECFSRDPTNADAMRELQRLGWTRGDFRKALARSAHWPRQSERRARQGRQTLAIDISDVVHFLSGARRPTGIQRVQLEVVKALFNRADENFDVVLVAYAPAVDGWVEIERKLFDDIIDAMRSDGGKQEEIWRLLIAQITALLSFGDEAMLPDGTCLVNLGSSWAFANYFLALRNLRTRVNIRYIPFIHDCIPLLFPDFFVPALQRDFREWIKSTLQHADGIMVNSKATAKDVQQTARQFGIAVPEISTITLDAVFESGAAGVAGQVDENSFQLNNILRNRFDISHRKFVLFVGTLEPRKNHILALKAWTRLIAERGIEGTPQLVCVGGRGWRNNAIQERLDANRDLNSKVTLLHDLADVDLHMLYRGSRFTIYPSLYEGWGLPVTESLSMGRVPLTSQVASLPEAGGTFAEYFELDDANDFYSKLVRLIDDDAYLAQKEAGIAKEFRPRTWAEISSEIVGVALSCRPPEPADEAAMALPYGTFVKLARDPPSRFSSGVISGEGLRYSNWGALDEQAAWLPHAATAELIGRVPQAECAGSLRLYLLLTAVPSEEAWRSQQQDAGDNQFPAVVVSCGGEPVGQFHLEAGRERWIVVDVLASGLAHEPLRLKLDVQSASASQCPPRTVGVVAIYVCDPADETAKQRFIEGIALDAARYAPGLRYFDLIRQVDGPARAAAPSAQRQVSTADKLHAGQVQPSVCAGDAP